MAKNNSTGWIRITFSAIGLALILGSILLAMGSQNQKLENGCKRIDVIETQVSENEIDIAVIKTDVKYIRKGIDEIKEELRK